MIQHQNRCLLKKDKNALAYGVEGGDSSRALDARPPGTEYAVKHIFWRRATIVSEYSCTYILFFESVYML